MLVSGFRLLRFTDIDLVGELVHFRLSRQKPIPYRTESVYIYIFFLGGAYELRQSLDVWALRASVLMGEPNPSEVRLREQALHH